MNLAHASYTQAAKALFTLVVMVKTSLLRQYFRQNIKSMDKFYWKGLKLSYSSYLFSVVNIVFFWSINGSFISFMFTAKSCGRPQIPLHGNIKSHVFTFRSKVYFECNPGFKLVGDKYRQCQANQTWSGRASICKRKKWCYLVFH